MTRSAWLRIWCLLISVFTASATTAAAQEPAAVRSIVLPSLDPQVRARLLALDRKLAIVASPDLAASLVGHLSPATPPWSAFLPILTDPDNVDAWEQLPEQYYRLAIESGDALVTLPESATSAKGGVVATQVRRLCQQRLALLPRSCLDGYRERIDAEARALLDEGRRTRSPIPLRRLVDELFCSRVSDQALDLLGDLAFERGDFADADHWWSLLIPSGDGALRFPSPQVDLARIRAKRILAHLFDGRLDDARQQIERFRQENPHARGALAGRDDLYADTLTNTLRTFQHHRNVNNDEPWLTFGGDATRNRPLSQGLSPHLWADGPTWSVKLPSLAREVLGREPVLDRTSLTRRLAFHPIIVQQQVLIADHRSVISYHLATGKELFRYDLKTAGLHDIGPGIDETIRMPRFTLSADQERVYVRLGRLDIGPRKEPAKDDASYLVCLDLTEPDRVKKRELWHVKAGAGDKTLAFFEGAPLVHEGSVYIALSKLIGRRTNTSIVCYDLHGRPRWTREVCETPEFEETGNGPRHRQHLLTWAAGQIAYSSNAGAIVAVNAWTGQPTWGVRYPSRGPLLPDAEPSPRDLVPCVYADGRVFAAPLDTDRLFCIEATTGRIRWEVADIEIVHILGVAQGRVQVATRAGVQAIDMLTGRSAWAQPTEGRLPSLGRGLLAGGWLLWPTTDDLLPYRAVTLGDGQLENGTPSVLPEPAQYDPTILRHLPVGNPAFGQGSLAIAGLDELVVFVPSQQAPPPDKLPQARIDTLYQQARQHACTGNPLAAGRAYLDLLNATRADSRAADWRTLIEGRMQMLVREASVTPRGEFQAVFTAAQAPASIRLTAWTCVANAGTPEEARAVCERILQDRELRQAWLPGTRPEQGAAWVLRWQQRHRLTVALGDHSDVSTLARYLALQGDVPIVRDDLAGLAGKALHSKRWSEAADAYRRLAALPLPGERRAPYLLGLARAYEGQNDFRSAWQIWTALETQFGDRVEPTSGKTYRRLMPSARTEPYLSALALSQVDGPTLPIVHAWEHADGPVLPAASSDRRDDTFFCVQAGRVTCRALAEGQLRWRRTLEFAPTWLDRWQDLVVLVGRDGAEVVAVADGRTVWSYPAASRLGKVGSVRAGVPVLAQPTAGLVHAELWGDTLLLLDDQRQLVRLHLTDGHATWSHASPAVRLRPLDAGIYQPFLLPLRDRVLVQNSFGQLVWLGPKTHLTREGSRPWQQAPLRIGACVVLPGEEGRVLAYDAAVPDRLLWTYKARHASSLTGELPRLFVRNSALIVLTARNDGHEWTHLDAERGKPLWTVPTHRFQNERDYPSVCVGDTSFYYVVNSILYARSLNDGSQQWQRTLPNGSTSWRVRYNKSYLTVHPVEGSAKTPFFVGLIDPWKGGWLQRLAFANATGPCQVMTTPGHLLVSVGGRNFGFHGLDGE